MAPAQPLPGLNWYDINDPASPGLDELAKRHGLHELEIEDCRHAPQRAKVTEHDDYLFCIAKRLRQDAGLGFEDLDLFLGRDYLITVHSGCQPIVDRARKRAAAENATRLDRIFYLLFDEIVDEYLPALDQIAEQTSDIESDVLENPHPRMLRVIFDLKRKLITFRRNAGAMREVSNTLIRHEKGILANDLDPYMRDIYDHMVRTADLIESYRDLLTGSLDIYLSAVANRTNEVMKVLTIYGTVALPLIIITGFFGMNLPLPFQHSLHGLASAVGLMVLSTVLVLLYFKRKGWF